jgi:hypothetical protein
MSRAGGWEVEFTPEAERWVRRLVGRDANRVALAVEQLQIHGPNLGRPHVDSIRGSRHRNMKELRSVGGHLRALFAFDPRRRAVILLGGDKTHDWRGWYLRNTPLADKLYDRHLRSIGDRGSWSTRTKIGERSAGSCR